MKEMVVGTAMDTNWWLVLVCLLAAGEQTKYKQKIIKSVPQFGNKEKEIRTYLF
jgi:hypothetical protein